MRPTTERNRHVCCHVGPQVATADQLSAEERTRSTMDRYLQVLIQRGDFAQFFADDVVWTTMETGDVVRGRAAVAGLITALHTQMFDAHPEVDAVSISAGTAYLEARFVGTHTGDFFGIAPTGIKVSMPMRSPTTCPGTRSPLCARTSDRRARQRGQGHHLIPGDRALPVSPT